MGYRVLRDYPRRAHLEFFRRNPNPFYSVSFELEATQVRARARALGASTYAALVWAHHRALLGIDAFRTRLQGEEVVLYDSLRVGMTVPSPGRMFTFATLVWDDDAERFLARAAATIASASARVDLAGGAAPDFAYYTALLKVPFSSFTHVALADPTAGQPEAAFGKFEERDGRTFVPVGVLVNHLYVDGADLSKPLAAGLNSSERRELTGRPAAPPPGDAPLVSWSPASFRPKRPTMSLASSVGASYRAVLLAGASILLATPALAIEPPKKKPRLLTQGFSSPELEVAPSLVTHPLGTLRDARSTVDMTGLQPFFDRHSADWAVRWDERANRPHLIQGVGIPLLPGRGNALAVDVPRNAAGEPELAGVERLLRDFMNNNPDLLRVPGDTLRLDRNRSLATSGGRTLFVEFQQVHKGVPVEGANVFFRINNGNIVQLGADRVGDVSLDTRPSIARERAFAKLLGAVGVKPAEVSEKLDAGTLKIYPALPRGEGPGAAFAGARGRGYRHLLVWEFTFRRAGDVSTYKGVVDARTGALLQLLDLNVYSDATVRGGIYPRTNTDTEVVRALPFATVTNNGTKNTSSSGGYDFAGGTATLALDGQFFRMNDNCGTISLSNSVNGNLELGNGAGTDCTTPGSGGAGNTHASRSGFFHLTNINRKAVGFLPGNAWLGSKVTANMNINDTCNGFWNGSTLNFYRSGEGCSNTGEIAAIFLHEWGHGMDTNSGGSAPGENGSGEAVGDTFAFLETRDSCIGPNFRPGVNCHNCVNCTGVRDVGDFALGGPATIARPDTIADNDGINCDRFSCPFFIDGIFPYQGPMGYQGHCESLIAGSANWDLAQMLVAAHGEAQGWATMDNIWYGSLTPSKSAYQLVSGGKCNPAATVNGCGATNWYTVYLAVDDDDGNLANGTPNGCRIWDAFDAHGIACGPRTACSGPCSPAPQADAGPDRTINAGESITLGTPAVGGHSYSWSPGGAATAQITVSPAITTTFTVTATTGCGTASDAVTVSVSSPATELITNGALEGSVSPWVRSGPGAFYTANAGFPHGGSGYLYLGVNDNVTGTVQQTVAIPSGAPSANLTFWLNVTSNETTATRQYDRLFVEVRDTAGALLSTLAAFSNLDKGTAGAYSLKGPFDLSAHRGQTVRVQFRVATDVAKRTTFRVDDVSLK